MDIVLSVDIATTPERLFETITTSKGLVGWFTPQAQAEPKVGTTVTLGFGPEMTMTYRVDVLEPARQVVWSCAEVPPGWNETHVSFDIIPAGESTNLRFSQIGFAPGYELLGTFTYLWAQVIRSLKVFLESGTGEPWGSPASKAAGTT